MSDEDISWPGGCACGAVRYALRDRPLFVHCCHCRWCQRETGASYALNALIETNLIEVTAGGTRAVNTPSESGKGQIIHRCGACHVALW
ncbi:MAG: GFA family protein, partial [Pseudomonadota bacterium]